MVDDLKHLEVTMLEKTYDEDNDIFIGKKPYASWVLNVAEARWQSPIGDAPELTEKKKKLIFMSGMKKIKVGIKRKIILNILNYEKTGGLY